MVRMVLSYRQMPSSKSSKNNTNIHKEYTSKPLLKTFFFLKITQSAFTHIKPNSNNSIPNVTLLWAAKGKNTFSDLQSGVSYQCSWTGREQRECSFYSLLVPDAESFGLLDVEEWSFNLWLVVSLALSFWGGESTPVDVWVLLLKLRRAKWLFAEPTDVWHFWGCELSRCITV